MPPLSLINLPDSSSTRPDSTRVRAPPSISFRSYEASPNLSTRLTVYTCARSGPRDRVRPQTHPHPRFPPRPRSILFAPPRRPRWTDRTTLPKSRASSLSKTNPSSLPRRFPRDIPSRLLRFYYSLKPVLNRIL